MTFDAKKVIETCARRAAGKIHHVSDAPTIHHEFAWVEGLIDAALNARSYDTESGYCWCFSRNPDPLNSAPRNDDDHDEDCRMLRAALIAIPREEREDGDLPSHDS